MKKYIFSLGLIAAALTLFSCEREALAPKEEPVVVPESVPFEIVANVDTKTTAALDGSNVVVSWAEGDAVNVFHAVAGSTDYSSNDMFTYVSENNFSGSLAGGALTEEAYDWYVLYPYNSYKTTPTTGTKGYMAIGSSGATIPQVQNGNGSVAHLSGAFFPLYGKALAVPAADKPVISLKQSLSVLKVHVTNKNDDPLTVTSVSFKAPTDIVGTYYIGFTGDSPVFTASGASFVSDTAILEVVGGSELAKDESADFYIGIKPFSASTGTLTLAVNGYEKSFELTSQVDFLEGKKKTLNFKYDKTIPAPISTESGPVTVGFESAEGFTATTTYNNTTEKFQGTEGMRWGILSGSASTTSAISGSQSMLLRDYTTANNIVPYTYTEYRLSTVKEVAFKAKNTSDGYGVKLSYSTDLGATWTDAETFALTTTADDYSHVFETELTNAMFRFTMVFPASRVNKKDIILDDVVFSMTEIGQEPVITLTSANPMNVANTASEQEIVYSIEHPSGATLTASTEADWIAGISTAVDGKVTFNVAAQANDAAARSAVITLKYSGAEDVEVTVNQAAGDDYAAAETYVWNLASGDLGSAYPSSVTKGTYSKTDQPLTWTTEFTYTGSKYLGWDNTKGVQIGKANNPVTLATFSTSGFTGNITQIVVNASTASSATAYLSVSVDGETFKFENSTDPVELSTDATDYTFTGDATGTVVITLSQNTTKALYLKSISFNVASE